MGNVGKDEGSCLAGRAAVAWTRWRRTKRLVSGWLTLEKGEWSVAETVERRVGEEE